MFWLACRSRVLPSDEGFCLSFFSSVHPHKRGRDHYGPSSHIHHFSLDGIRRKHKNCFHVGVGESTPSECTCEACLFLCLPNFSCQLEKQEKITARYVSQQSN